VPSALFSTRRVRACAAVAEIRAASAKDAKIERGRFYLLENAITFETLTWLVCLQKPRIGLIWTKPG
jgi:hypothetical protein